MPGSEKVMDIMCMQYSTFVCGSQIVVDVLGSALYPAAYLWYRLLHNFITTS